MKGEEKLLFIPLDIIFEKFTEDVISCLGREGAELIAQKLENLKENHLRYESSRLYGQIMPNYIPSV